LKKNHLLLKNQPSLPCGAIRANTSCSAVNLIVSSLTSVTRWFEQKRAQYLSKNAQFGAQSKNTKKGEKTTDLNKSEDS